MLKAERHRFIIDQLLRDQKIVTTDISLLLNVSEDTIRRDINQLQNQKMLKKVFGGAMVLQEEQVDVFNIVISLEEQKRKIVTKALSLLYNGQVIIMSGGSTNLVFAKLIPADLNATIYTYSLPIAMQLSQHPNIDLIFIGGKMQKKAMVTIGMDVVQVLSKIKADICFIGASAINVNQGLTEIGYEVSIVKRAMIESSDKVVSMFSCAKLNTKMAHVVCELNQLNTIVTNLDPDDLRLQEYSKSGIQVL